MAFNWDAFLGNIATHGLDAYKTVGGLGATNREIARRERATAFEIGKNMPLEEEAPFTVDRMGGGGPAIPPMGETPGLGGLAPSQLGIPEPQAGMAPLEGQAARTAARGQVAIGPRMQQLLSGMDDQQLSDTFAGAMEQKRAQRQDDLTSWMDRYNRAIGNVMALNDGNREATKLAGTLASQVKAIRSLADGLTQSIGANPNQPVPAPIANQLRQMGIDVGQATTALEVLELMDQTQMSLIDQANKIRLGLSRNKQAIKEAVSEVKQYESVLSQQYGIDQELLDMYGDEALSTGVLGGPTARYIIRRGLQGQPGSFKPRPGRSPLPPATAPRLK